MATTYTVTVETYRGEPFTDSFGSGLRGEIASLERSPEFNLGKRIGTAKDDDDDWDLYGGIRYYYYHNGRITVRTQYHQLTIAQRTGSRGYDTPAAVLRARANDE